MKTEQQKKRHCEYSKKYREENKEKVSEQKKKYHKENKEKVSVYGKKYYEKNKEKLSEQKKKYREENKEKVSEQKKKWREENKEKVSEHNKNYRNNKDNFFRIMLSTMNYRSRRRNRDIDPSITVEYLEQLWEDSNNKCALSGVEMSFKRHTKNLISPDRIDSSLGYIKGNIQFVSKQANLTKMDMSQEEFDAFILNCYNTRFKNI